MSQKEEFNLPNLTNEENRKLTRLLAKSEEELTVGEQQLIIKLLEKSGVPDSELDQLKDDVEGFTEPVKPMVGRDDDEAPVRQSKFNISREQALQIASGSEKLTEKVNNRKRITSKFLKQLKKERAKELKEQAEAEKPSNAGEKAKELLQKQKEQLEKATETAKNLQEGIDKVKKGAKITMNTNKFVKKNVDKLAKSEAEKEQILETVDKRKKTNNQQKFLNEVAQRKIPSRGAEPALKDGGDGGGAPKPEPDAPGRPAGAPIVKIKKAPEKLPELVHPSTTIVLAKKFSGKTNLLLNILDKDKFDNVWVVSLTGFTGKLDGLCQDEDCLLEDVSDTMINELLKLHKESPMKSLIVFDDVIGQVDMRSKGMNKLATMGRNFGISIVISAQDFFKIPPVWRRNSEYWYIGCLTDSNIEAASKELSVPSFTKKRIRQELSEIARDKNHDWLFYDDRNTKFKKLFGNQFRVIV